MLRFSGMYGRCNVVELLLKRVKYPVDEADNCGSTPLMDALRSGHVSIANVLATLHNVIIQIIKRTNYKS